MPGSGSSGTASIGTVVDKQWQRADDGVRKHLSSAVKFLRMLEARTGGVYSVAFVPTGMWYLYLLLPMHWLMGPIHGALVNWGGHMYGYVNFKVKDESRNALPIDFLVGGELYQNNHHVFGTSPNFAKRWFELDTTYQVMRMLHLFRIIRLKKPAVEKIMAKAEAPATVSIKPALAHDVPRHEQPRTASSRARVSSRQATA